MRSALGNDAGSASLEFAIALPSALVVVSLVLGGILVSAQQVRVVDAAGIAARAAGRGESTTAAAAALDGLAVSGISTYQDGPIVCAVVSASVRFGALDFPLSSRSCAAADGK